MAVPARFEIIDHEARLRSGDMADSPYGSLLGGGPRPVKKKRPVLVLAVDELEQAHQAIAMGGAQIMESADDPVAEARPRMPAMLLGLAPLGADEDWEPPVSAPYNDPLDQDWPAVADEEVFDEIEDEAEEPVEIPAPAMRMPDPVPPVTPACSLDDSEAWEAPVPSIAEQLQRMRYLTRPQALPPVVEEDEAPPLPALEPEPAAAVERQSEPFAEIPLPPEPTPEEPAPQEPVFDLPLAAVVPEPVEPEPQPDEFHDGPDLSWMMPKERRQFQFADSETDHSHLRARLVQSAPDIEPEIGPSLWDRFRDWLARVLA